MALKTIIIAGGSGLIGTALSHRLKELGKYQVRILSRSPEKIRDFDAFYWEPMKNEIDEKVFEQAHAIVNLAGANIGENRWTKRRKKILRESRIASTRIFQKYLQDSETLVKYISASAQGFYGDRKDNLLTEDMKSNKGGFQSQLCIEWEHAVKETVPAHIDYCIMRNAVVLSEKGGPLAKLKLPIKFHLVPQFGDGKHYMSWIHIDDIAEAYRMSIEKSSYTGVINVAAGAITYKAFAQAIKKTYNTKLPILPAPAPLLKLGLGKMSEMVLESARMSNAKLRNLGIEITYENIDKALADIAEHHK